MIRATQRSTRFSFKARTDEVRSVLEGVDGVTGVTDLHGWQICSRVTVATTHVETDVATVEEAEAVTRRVHDERAAYDVDHATVELCPASLERDTRLNTHGH